MVELLKEKTVEQLVAKSACTRAACKIALKPHIISVTACGDGTAEAATCHQADNRGYLPNGNHMVKVVKDRMASPEVSQSSLDGACCRLGRLHGLPLQPQCTHLRWPASDRDWKRMHYVALMVHHAGAITRNACNYLSHWAQGARQHLPTPTYYHLLETMSEEHPT